MKVSEVKLKETSAVVTYDLLDEVRRTKRTMLLTVFILFVANWSIFLLLCV